LIFDLILIGVVFHLFVVRTKRKMVQLRLLSASLATAFAAVYAAPGDIIKRGDEYIGFGGGESADQPRFDLQANYDESTDTVTVDFQVRTNRGGVFNRHPHFSLGVVSSKLFCDSGEASGTCLPDPTQDNANDALWAQPDGGSFLNGKTGMYLAAKYLFISSRYSSTERLGTCKVLLVDELCKDYDGCNALGVRDNEGFFLAKGQAIAQGKFRDVTDEVTLTDVVFEKDSRNGGRSHKIEGKMSFKGSLFGSGEFKFVKTKPTYITWNQYFTSADDKTSCTVNDASSIYQGERGVKMFQPHSSTRSDGFAITMLQTEPPTASPTKSPTTLSPTSSPTPFPTTPPVPTPAPTTGSPSASPTKFPTPAPIPTRAPTTGSPSASPTSRPTAAPVTLPCPRELEWYRCRIKNTWWQHLGATNDRKNRIKKACLQTRGCVHCDHPDPNAETCQPRIGRDGSRLSATDVCSGSTPGEVFNEPRCVQFEKCPDPEEMSACNLLNDKPGYNKFECEKGTTVNRGEFSFTSGSKRCAYHKGICRAVGDYFAFRKLIVKLPGLFDKIRGCPYDENDPENGN
jgi:hypothetical protein